MTSPFPSIPLPTNTIPSMYQVILAIRQVVNLLTVNVQQPSVPTLTKAAQIFATTGFVSDSLSTIAGPSGISGGGTVVAGVTSFNNRIGDVTLASSDVTGAGGAPIVSPAFTGTPTGPTASSGTNTTQLATTAFVDNAVAASTTGVSSFNGRTGNVTLTTVDVTNALAFTPIPEAPQNGKAYGRNDAAWTQVIMSTGDMVDGGSF